MLKSLTRLFGAHEDRDGVRPLYAAVVAEARQPHWYLEGGVADTRDGRFEMVSAILALVLIRMEALGETAKGPSTALAEVFVEDMDGQLREEGVGDVSVGKHIGKMMGALGGRLNAYRDAIEEEGDLERALVRNLYRGDPPGKNAIGFIAARLRALTGELDAMDGAAIVAGGWPGR